MKNNLIKFVLGLAYFNPNPFFEYDIKPIFQENCVSCHNSRWLNYNEVKQNIKLIEDKLLIRLVMPPDKPLGPIERSMIRKWIDKGMREN